MSKKTLGAPRHMGWQVVGVSPNALAAARAKHAGGRWDEPAWVRNARLQPVAPAFACRSAALACLELARKLSWQRLDIRELATGDAYDGASKLF